MTHMRGAAVLFLTFALLWAVVARLNDALAPLQVHLFAGGLFVVYAALAWEPSTGGLAVFLAGCLCGADSPRAAFGAHAVFFAFAYLILRAVRERFPGDLTVGRVAAALAANAGIFLAMSAVLWRGVLDPRSEILRLLVDLTASQAFILLVAPWFFALQERALVLARAQGV